ncbi:N-acetylmuramoyl-L-alanine amidase [Trichothermofontia sp.]
MSLNFQSPWCECYLIHSWYGAAIAGLATTSLALITPAARAESSLFLAYPPPNHETTASQIFLIGTAPPGGTVLVNGQAIARSPAGHFAPSFPLQVGKNTFRLQYQDPTQDQTLELTVTRLATTSPLPTGPYFAPNSLEPAVDIARLPGELICFSAIAPPQAAVSVVLGGQTLRLTEQPRQVSLPDNAAVLTGLNQPTVEHPAGQYQGCLSFSQPAVLGAPQFRLTWQGQTVTQPGPGQVTILNPSQLSTIAVTAPAGTARTGPSTTYSRLTPLPTGTQAQVTGQASEWLRLDYGAWIRASETQPVATAVPPRTVIRSLKSRERDGWTDVIFPLQVPVPVTVTQDDRRFTLTLHNTTAQTDTIYLATSPVIRRLDWSQPAPDRVTYDFQLKSPQQWGYQLRYEGTSLILSLRHPPDLRPASPQLPLRGVHVLLDPGHGSDADPGARGPTGYPEKDVALIMAKLVRDRLQAQGATVTMTREGDDDLYPNDRVAMIEQHQPTIVLSLHYNALPDDGDALNTQGLAAFWYTTQSHSLAAFLHDYLVRTLDRPSYGVFWNNLALTRPTIAPSVMLELGFMIHPEEFEWIIDPAAQQALATAIADGLRLWVEAAIAAGE